ncbi:MAG: tetratricopeptide repeat protein, partial [Caulobacteraceae bacterium]
AYGVGALLTLGELERARAWAERAVLLDPGDPSTCYNLACAMVRGGDLDYALDLLAQALASSGRLAGWAKADPDLEPLRGDPRFAAITAADAPRSESDAVTLGA